DPPQVDYELTNDIRILGPQKGNQLAVVREKPILNTDGSFDLVMQYLHFGTENELKLDVELVFAPTPKAKLDHAAATADARKKYDAEKQRLLKKSFMESVRDRIKDASNIKPRPSWDLRDEERTVIYRKLIGRLMLDSWGIATKNPKDEGNLRV